MCRECTGQLVLLVNESPARKGQKHANQTTAKPKQTGLPTNVQTSTSPLESMVTPGPVDNSQVTQYKRGLWRHVIRPASMRTGSPPKSLLTNFLLFQQLFALQVATCSFIPCKDLGASPLPSKRPVPLEQGMIPTLHDCSDAVSVCAADANSSPPPPPTTTTTTTTNKAQTITAAPPQLILFLCLYKGENKICSPAAVFLTLSPKTTAQHVLVLVVVCLY